MGVRPGAIGPDARQGARLSVFVAALFAAAASATAPAATADGLGTPRASDGRVRWDGPALAAAEADSAAALAFAAGDSLAGWAIRAADTTASPVAVLEYARGRLVRGFAATADSALASPRLGASPWGWRALRLRAEAALSAADTARAESLLAGGGGGRWSEADRAARTLLQARLAAARGRPAEADQLSRLVVLLYPSLGPAGPALALLDTLALRRGEPLAAQDERAGAESDFLRGARTSAIARFRRALPRVESRQRWAVALRLAEVLRASRMPRAARLAADTAIALAPDGEMRARARLERARALRDAGASDSALAAFAEAAGPEANQATRADAWWEYAREAEDESRWERAIEGFRAVVATAGRRADDARVRAGLVHYARGDADSALAWWAGSASEAARFWRGVALRPRARAASDSLLGPLAAKPGYGFYRAAARETLGVRGWPGSVAAMESWYARGEPEATRLLAWGLEDEAFFVFGVTLAASHPAAGGWLRAAARAIAAGRFATATRWAESAFAAAERAGSDSLAWAAVTWAYPPAFEAEIVAAETLGVERALLWALIRQESRFDPRARSRSDALGLAQLKRSTAGDAAQWLREPKPTESALFAPDTSIRLGARYLKRMLDRHDGVVAVALAAYNAGPSTIRRDWRELLARGGEALYAEFASNADSQDYARRILGFRQAYRELRPTTAP